MVIINRPARFFYEASGIWLDQISREKGIQKERVGLAVELRRTCVEYVRMCAWLMWWCQFRFCHESNGWVTGRNRWFQRHPKVYFVRLCGLELCSTMWSGLKSAQCTWLRSAADAGFRSRCRFSRCLCYLWEMCETSHGGFQIKAYNTLTLF